MSVNAIKKMNRQEIENKIRNLIDELNVLTKFYDEGTPTVSDKEWDDKYFELQNLENEFNIYFEDSPTQRINYQVVNGLNKVKHNHPMLSLDKTKDIENVKSFVGNKDYIVMAKMDGLTCSLTYENGKLVAAETRGNGEIGEDILHNALQVKNIPCRISRTEKIVVDGEIICDYKTFENFSNEYKNPRNFASGSIRLLDSKESANRGLSFIAWDCIQGLEEETELHSKLWALKEQLGFNIVPYIIKGKDPIDMLIEKIKKFANDYGYPIDGVVIKYNNIKEYESAGRTDHHFKGGLAYKFYDDEYETVLRKIDYDIGRTGVLTPVAIFDAIDIDGTECTRASLHNISILEETLHGPGWEGQKIKVFKANQIIPQISWAEEDDKEYDKKYLDMPHKCPICGGEVSIHQEVDSKVLMCDNPDCEGKLLNKIDHFCSKKGLDIKGLSKAGIEWLMNMGWLNGIKDIFNLEGHFLEWTKQAGWGPASVMKILNAINDAKLTTLDKVIAAAGIPEIGTRVGKDLAKHYKTWQEFRDEDSYLHIDGIGEVMNNNLLKFDYTEMDWIVSYCLTFKEEEQKEETNSLEGKVFCITGKVHIFKNRAELQADIESKGGKVVSSMSSKVTHLINNDNMSTTAKNNAAKAAGIPIITEEEYKEMCNESI